MKNFIWIVPDGARSIPFDDPLGRLPIFDNIKRVDGFGECKNMFTPATSTYMSFSSFLRGIDVTKMAYRYGELKATKFEVPTIDKLFKKNGFNIYFLSFYPDDLREQIDNDIVDLVKDKEKLLKAFYENNIDDMKKFNEYVKYFLKNEELKEPYFLLIHFGISFLPENFFNSNLENEFIEIYNLVKPKFKNANVLINADHGFPFYNTIQDFPGTTHPYDMSLHNIMPICLGNFFDDIEKKSSLIDIYPTICDLYGFEKHKFIDGESLFVQGNNKRIIRVENRFPAEKDRMTTLVINNERIVYNYDNKIFKKYNKLNNEIKIDIIDKDTFFKYEQLFDKKREEFIKYNFDKKTDKLNELFLYNNNLFIKTYTNEFLKTFLSKYCKNSDKSITIDNLKSSNEIEKFHNIVILVDSIYTIADIKNIENIKNITKEIIVVDRYLNVEEKIVDKVKYLERKRKISSYIKKRKESQKRRKEQIELFKGKT